MLDEEALIAAARRFADGDLSAVADVGGWRALDVDVQAKLRHLLRGMSAYETPRPLGEENGDVLFDWLAVPTGDHDALLDELRLTCAIPAPQQLGLSVWARGGVYVTPRWDDWTVVCGYDLPYDSGDAMRSFLERLSRRFGAAHWYGADYGYAGWALAENGELVRLYMYGDSPDQDEVFGEPHRAEVDATLMWYADIDDDKEDGRPRCGPAAVAAYGSVDPTAVGPHTRVEGHALIAVQDPASVPPGVFPLGTGLGG
ncbi:hypothetical protein [Nocardia pneumoniae]|uniref:hypothetical protein n=1 Tax=Nocardia pneumoniae TaxID=228601 RepID=UPI0002F56C89|nr:hypothetical protein [Nocardia pneumoniae]